MNALILTAILGSCIYDTCPVGDFNGNGVLNALDIDILVDQISRHSRYPRYDLDDNGLVNRNDLSTWLALAGPMNGMSGPYLYGDANLDGSVNAGDLNFVGRSWGSLGAVWWGLGGPRVDPRPGGDFSADGRVDAADLNILAINWQKSVPYRAVPEPGGWMLLVLGLIFARKPRWRRAKRGATHHEPQHE